MNNIKLQNIDQGNKTEIKVKTKLENYFDIKLEKLVDFHPFDYIDEYNTHYEIKGRNNYYNKYPTTMVGKNKIEYALKHNLNCYFIFNFIDDTYYYKLNRDDDLVYNIGGRCDRGKNEYKTYCYIPINKLKKIST